MGTPFASWSGRARRCTWKSSRSDTNWPSSIDRGAHVFVSRRPTASCGHGSRTPGAVGAPAVHIVTPETVVAWHRRGFRLFWTWKSRQRTGRPGVPPDVRALIREMSTANPLWGAPRIHGELQKLGISVSQSTVAKYMRRPRRPPSQTWRTFLTNHASQIMAADLFVVPTVTFRLPLRARNSRARPSTDCPRGPCDTRRIVRSLWWDLAFDVTGELLPQEQVRPRVARGIGR